MIWFKKFNILLALTLLLSACTPAPPKQGTAIDAIQSALQEGIHDNQKVNRANANATPAAVNNALLPSVAVNLPAANTDSNEKHFNLTVNDVPAKTFFMGLVEGTKYNMIVSPEISGTISLNLKDVTIEQALDAVHDAYGYEYQRTAYGFEIMPAGLQTQIFTVNYLDIQRIGRSQTALSSNQLSDVVGTVSSGVTTNTNGQSNQPANPATPTITNSNGSTVETRSDEDIWKDLQTTIQAMIGTKDGRSVIVNPESGEVVVRAYPDELRTVSSYLDTLENNLDRQVVLEAKVLEVILDNSFQSGINWNALGFSQNGAGSTANPVPTSPYFTLTIGGGFNAIINLLATEGNVQTLSSPRVATINNQKAVIKVGTDQFFVTGVTTNVTPNLSSGPTTSSTVSLTPFFNGITLDVTPQISADGNIILHVHPTVSVVTEQTKTITLGSGTTNQLVLPLAVTSGRESDSIVSTQNGQVIVIGGLMQNDTSESLRGTPGASKLPFLGMFFRNTTQTARKSELVILLRATVVNTNKNWNQQMAKSSADFQAMDRGFHAGAYPEIFGTAAEKTGTN